MAKRAGLICNILLVFLQASSGFSLLNRGCPQKKYYTCQLDPDAMMLWCDDSNVTEIPHPETIHGYSPTGYAEAIFMNNSCLQRINTATLRKYHCLRTLDLSDNLIVSLPKTSFFSCGKLKTLRIAGNNLTSVRANTFAGLKELVELDLGRNQIASLGLGAFDDVIKLENLKLNNNRLRHLEEKIFEKLIFLQSLDISDNFLKSLTVWHLRGLAQLTFLNLRSNRIASVEKIMFVSTPRLQRIDLRNNSIACLPHNIFNRTDVSAVKLSNNKLRIPQPDWFRKLRRKERREQFLDVDSLTSNNPWHCGCKSIAYLRYLKYEIGDLHWWVRKLDVRCASPPAFQGRMLSSLSEEEINDQFNGSCSMLTSEKHFCDLGSPKGVVSARKPKVPLAAAETDTITSTTAFVDVAASFKPDLKSDFAKERIGGEKVSDGGIYLTDNNQKQVANSNISVAEVACIAMIVVMFFLLGIIFRGWLNRKASSQNPPTAPHVPVSYPNFVAVNQPTMPIDQRQDYLQPMLGPTSCERDSGVCSEQNRSWILDDHSYCSIQGNDETLPKRACCSRSLSTECLSSVCQHQRRYFPALHQCRPNKATHSGTRSRLINECRSFGTSRSSLPSDEPLCSADCPSETDVFVSENRNCTGMKAHDKSNCSS